VLDLANTQTNTYIHSAHLSLWLFKGLLPHLIDMTN